MSMLLTFLIIACVFVLIAVVTFLIIIFYAKEQDKHEEPFVINLMAHYSQPIKGHAIGLEVNEEKVGDRILIEYSPRDIDVKAYANKMVENVKVVVDKDKIITLPKGTLSNFRTVKILLAPHPEDYSVDFKNNILGKSVMALTEVINTANIETSIVREGSDRKTNMLHKLGDGEITNELINRVFELNKDILKNSKDQKEGFGPGYPKS